MRCIADTSYAQLQQLAYNTDLHSVRPLGTLSSLKLLDSFKRHLFNRRFELFPDFALRMSIARLLLHNADDRTLVAVQLQGIDQPSNVESRHFGFGQVDSFAHNLDSFLFAA
jgi:hypothetical protein